MSRAYSKTQLEPPHNAGTADGGRYAITVSKLTAAYGRMSVLRDIDLEVCEGESVAIMGPNGAGKTTLLKCLIGAVRPAAGSVTWFGEAVTRTQAVRRQVGYVGQESGLYPELTVLENLIFSGRMYGVANIHEQAELLLANARLESHANRFAGQLSKGMQQRVAIVRALVHEPRLIVLDEPSSNLDVEGRHWLELLFEGWRQAGQTVCFASHDVAQTNALADRIVELAAGRIVTTRKRKCPVSLLRLAT